MSTRRRKRQKKQFTVRPIVAETLEDRLLLDGDGLCDLPFDNSHSNAIRTGVNSLTSVFDNVETLDQISGGLNLFQQQDSTPLSIGSLLDLSDVFESGIATPTSNYLTGTANPTSDGLVAAIQAANAVDSITGGETTSGPSSLLFTADFGDSVTINDFRLGLSTIGEVLGMELDQAVSGDITISLNVEMTYGVTLDENGLVDGTASLEDLFFVDDLRITIGVDAILAGSFGAQVGFLDVNANVGTQDFLADLDVVVSIDEGLQDDDGRTRLSDLTSGLGALSLIDIETVVNQVNGVLAFDIEIGPWQFDGAPEIAIGGDLVGGEVTATANEDYESISTPFRNIDASMLALGVEAIGGWMSSFDDSGALATAVPFSEASLGDLLDIDTGFDAITTGLRDSEGLPTFDSAQTLPLGNSTLSGFDPATQTLFYDVALDLGENSQTLPISLLQAVGAVNGLAASGPQNIVSMANATFTMGIDLSQRIGAAALDSEKAIDEFRSPTEAISLSGFQMQGSITQDVSNLTGDALYGILGLDVGNLSIVGGPSVTLNVAEDKTIRELLGGLVDPSTLFETSFSGSTDLTMTDIGVADVLLALPANASLVLRKSNFAGQGTELLTQNVGVLNSFSGLSFDDLFGQLLPAVEQFGQSLQTAATGGLSVVRTDPNDVLDMNISGLTTQLENEIEGYTAETQGLLSLQRLEPLLEQQFAFGLGNNVDIAIETDFDADTNDLLIDFDITFAGSNGVPFGLNISQWTDNTSSDGLVAGGEISTDGLIFWDADAELSLDTGFNLSNPLQPIPYLYDTTQLAANFEGTATLMGQISSLGILGLALDGDVSVTKVDQDTPTMLVTLPPSPTNGRYQLNALPTPELQPIEAGLAIELDMSVLPLSQVQGELLITVDNIATGEDTVVKLPDFQSMLDAVGDITLNLSTLAQGVDSLLTGVENALSGEIFGLKIPIIGEALEEPANAVRVFHEAIQPTLDDVAEDGAAVLEAPLKQALSDAFGGFVDVHVAIEESPPEILLTFSRPGTPPSLSTSYSANTSLGLPALGVDLDMTFEAELDHDFEISIGVNQQDGVFLATGLDEEFSVGATINAMGELEGRLGFLTVTGDIVDTGMPLFGGAISIDLQDPNGDGKLTLAELAQPNFQFVVPEVSGTANLDVLLTGEAFAFMPEVNSTLSIDWDSNDGPPEVSLTDVNIPLEGLLGNFVGSFMGTLNDIIAPIAPVAQALTEPLPILSDLLLESGIRDEATTLLTLAELFLPIDTGFIDAIAQVAEIVGIVDTVLDTIDDGPNGPVINFGDINFGTTDLQSDDAFKNGLERLVDGESPLADFIGGAANELANAIGLSGNKAADDSTAFDGFSIPLLDNPTQIFELLLGLSNDVGLIAWDIPELSFFVPIDISFAFPPFPALQMGFYGGVGMSADLNVGYDTVGLFKFKESNNPADLFDGFFIGDTDQRNGEGTDVPELEVFGEAKFQASLGVPGVAAAGVAGGLVTTVAADLVDSDGDGKLRGSEFLSGGCIIALGGSMDIELEVFVRVLGSRSDFPFANVNIADFSLTPNCPFQAGASTDDPRLASLENGTLTLFVGDNADFRSVQPENENETYSVGIVKNDIVVSAFGKQQTFKVANVDRIVADADGGNDTIVISTDVTVPVRLSGGSGNDVLVGGSGENTISGGSENDILVGGPLVDDMDGGSGDDILTGHNGDDKLEGGPGVDDIDGGDHDDTITDLSGETVVNGGDGSDIITTGNDNDTIDAGPGREDTVNSNGGNDLIFGGDGVDIIDAGIGEDEVYGGPGDDRIEGGDGGDILSGEDGEDTINGGDGKDIIIGGNDDDTLSGGANNDVIHGLDGVDTISGDGGEDEIYGGNGRDILDGGDNDDLIYGGPQGDTANGGLGADRIFGEDGEDTLNGDAGKDWIDGGKDNDTINGGTEADELFGREGEDEIRGNDGDDIIDGGKDDDRLFGEANEDIIFGGPGNDTIQGNRHNDTISGGPGNDTIFGGLLNDTITGDSGEDVIHGDGGDDIIDGGMHNDRIFGDIGKDYILGSDGDDIIEGNDGNDTIRGGRGADTIEGNAGKDYIDGGPQDDLIYAGSEDDEVYGRSGNDIIRGQAHNDTIDGGPGNDLLIGNDGKDKILGKAGIDVIYGMLGNDMLDGGEDDDRVHGDDGDDVLHGGEGSDLLEGDAGNDVLWGDGENDRLFGGLGKDSLNGGPGNDYLNAVAGLGNTLNGGPDNDTLIGSGEGSPTFSTATATGDFLNGNEGDDDIRGLGGADSIDGGPGRDTIDGGSHQDRITGGLDTDTIIEDMADLPISAAGDNIIPRPATPAEIGGDGTDSSGRWIQVSGSASNFGISKVGGVEQSVLRHPDGNTYVAWVDSRSGSNQIYVARRSNGKWEEVSGSASDGGVSQSTTDSRRPTLLAAENGIVAAWIEFDVNGQSDVRIVSSASNWGDISPTLPSAATARATKVLLAPHTNGFSAAWMKPIAGVPQVLSAIYTVPLDPTELPMWGNVTNVTANIPEAIDGFDFAGIGFNRVVAASFGQPGSRQVGILTANVGPNWTGQLLSVQGDNHHPAVTMQANVDQEGGNERAYDYYVAWQEDTERTNQVRAFVSRNSISNLANSGTFEMHPLYAADSAPRLDAESISDTLAYAAKPVLSKGDSIWLAWMDDDIRSSQTDTRILATVSPSSDIFFERNATDASGDGITNTGGAMRSLSISQLDGEPVVAWNETTDGSAEIYLRQDPQRRVDMGTIVGVPGYPIELGLRFPTDSREADRLRIQHAVVEWGDDTPDAEANDVLSLSLPHTYTQLTNYEVTVTLTNVAGEVVVGTVQIEMVPLLVEATPSEINEDESLTLTGYLFDSLPNADNDLRILWGDSPSPQLSQLANGQTTFSFTHHYADDPLFSQDEYEISVTLAGLTNDLAVLTETIIVANVAPEFNAGKDTRIQVSDEFTRQLDFADPGLLDSHTAQLDWGDGTTESIVVTDQARDFSISHRYNAVGVYDVSITIGDDDGGNTIDGFTVVVEGDSSDPRNPTFVGKLIASDRFGRDKFGSSLAFDGNRAVVGAPLEGDARGAKGAVYVYERTGDHWKEVAKLVAPTRGTGDKFGQSVAIVGESIFVGAPLSDEKSSDQGAVFVFELDGTDWEYQATLFGSKSATGDQFGFSIDAAKQPDGNTQIVVGAPIHETITGEAYVFHNSGSSWEEVARLSADDGEIQDRFGFSISTDGQTIVVGADHDKADGHFWGGSAYIYEEKAGKWTQQARVTSSDQKAFDRFASAVTVDGDTLVVAALTHKHSGNHGAVYVFERDDKVWKEVTKLHPTLANPVQESNDGFGSSLALDGETIVIGAYHLNDANQGSVYVAQREGGLWLLGPKIIAEDAQQFDLFGYSLAIAGDQILVGIFDRDDEVPPANGYHTGAVFVYQTNGTAPPRIPGDLGEPDGEVSFNDFLILARNFGKTNATLAEGDINGDGTIGFSDFLIMAANFGRRI